MAIPTFKIFGASHLIVIILTIVAIVSMFWVRRLTTNQKTIVRFTIASILICQVVAYNSWHLSHNSWNLKTELPLHTSWLANYLTIASLLVSRNNSLAQITYYIGTWSALLALLFPGVGQDFPSFRFWEYFISHCFILIGISYICIVKKVRITYQSMWVSFGYLALLGVVANLFNSWTGANYMYLVEVPGTEGFLPQHPYNIPILVVVILIFLHLQYLPYFYRNKIRQ